MSVKFDIKIFSASGRRKRFSRKALASWECSEIRYGGFADFSLTTNVLATDLPTLVATDLVEMWLNGVPRFRGEITGRERTADEPPKLTLTGYGRMLRAGAHVAHKRYVYPQSVDVSQAIRDVVRDWVQPFEPRPLSVRTLPVGQTISSTDAYIKMTKDVFDDIIKLAADRAIWGVDVINDPADGEYGTDRFYVEPVHTAADWFLPAPSKLRGGAEYLEQTDKVVNTLTIVGGTPKYPNLLYNGGFERPVFSGDQSAGNLLNSPGFEDRHNWSLNGGADYKSTGNNEGPAYEGTQMVQIDSVGESLNQTRNTLPQVIPGHDYEFGGHFRRQKGAVAASATLTIHWNDAGGALISSSVLPASTLAPQDATWRYYYLTARAPAGCAGFDFNVTLTSNDGSSGQGNGLVCDLMQAFDASVAGQDHWKLTTFGSAKILAQNWLYPDTFQGASGTPTGGSSVFVSQQSADANGQDIHLEQGASYRMDVTGNQSLTFQVAMKLGPGITTNAPFFLEMHWYRQDGSACGGAKPRFDAGAMAPGPWYTALATANVASDAVKLECYVTFRGTCDYVLDNLVVRDSAAYNAAAPGDFYIPDGPLQLTLRAADVLQGDAAHVAQQQSEATYGVKADIVSEEALTSVPDARSYAAAYFIANAIPPLPTQVECQEDGRLFRCGQRVKLLGQAEGLITMPLAIVKITHRYNGIYTVILSIERETQNDGDVILEEIRKQLRKQSPNLNTGGLTTSSQGSSSGGMGGGSGLTYYGVIPHTAADPTLHDAFLAPPHASAASQNGWSATTAEVVAARTRTVKGLSYLSLEGRVDAMEADLAAVAVPMGVPLVPAWLYQKMNLTAAGVLSDLTPFTPTIALPLTTYSGDLIDLNASGTFRTTAWGQKALYTTELTVVAAKTIQVDCTADNSAQCSLNGVAVGTPFGNGVTAPGAGSGNLGQPVRLTLNLLQGRNVLQFQYYQDYDAGGSNSGFTCVGVTAPAGQGLASLVDEQLAPVPASGGHEALITLPPHTLLIPSPGHNYGVTADFRQAGTFSDVGFQPVLVPDNAAIVVSPNYALWTPGVAAWTLYVPTAYGGASFPSVALVTIAGRGWSGSQTANVAATWTNPTLIN